MTKKKSEKSLSLLVEALRAGSPKDLEQLAAELIGRLLKVKVSVSKSGFQHGGDAGTAGRRDRHLRIECKRYAEGTPLGERELQGEIDDAIRRNPALEAWILVSTRRASENTEEVLNLKAREVGVPIIVIDWDAPKDALPDLAALCAWAPDLVETHYGVQAGAAAKTLGPAAKAVVARIEQELAPWKIGYEQLRQAAEQRVRTIWNNENESRAAFAQNAAGGAASHLVTRGSVLAALEEWWTSADVQPAVVYGAEGVGKTWAVLQWVLKELKRLPITLTFPSSAFHDIKSHSEEGVLEFLGSALHEVVRSQDRRFWLERLRKLFQRPNTEGPVMLLLVDGMNQEPSFDWRRLVQILQGGCFQGRVRVILTTQTHHLEDRLRGMRGISSGIRGIGVEPYDSSPGGELEQLLAQHGKRRKDIPSDLLQLARVPRLFPIVMKLRSSVALEGDATLSRLLWAHGRDELSLREERAFSEIEWEQWLLQLAESHWEAIRAGAGLASISRTYTLAELDDMVARPSFEPSLNYRRLQEIIDGTWMEPLPGRSGAFRVKATTIHLALGAAVLGFLEDAERSDAGSVGGTLARWLDPVAATSAAADILAAAMSIMVAKGLAPTSAIPGAIVAALLQSQNAQDHHRQQAIALAPVIFRPLLDTVERSNSRANASARHWALLSLHSISSENVAAWSDIYHRLVSWVAHVTCPGAADLARDDGSVKHQVKNLQEKIGTHQEGTRHVMGVPIRLHEWEQRDLAEDVPRLLLGKPLVNAAPVLVAATVALAIDAPGRAWQGLKWLVTLNPVDAAATVSHLENLSSVALEVPAGDGVHPELPVRVAALLLWLTGSEQHERKASTLRASFERALNYDEEYLAKPTRSIFISLERRHLPLLWDDEGVALFRRVQIAKPYLPDSAANASNQFVTALEAFADQLDVSKLDTNLSVTSADHEFAEFLPSLARYAPAALARIVHRWFCDLSTRSGEPRHWAGLRAPRYLILTGSSAVAAARELRLKRTAPPGQEERALAMRLLEIELLHASAEQQLDCLVEASDAFISLELLTFIQRPSVQVIQQFLTRWGTSNQRAVEVIFNCLAHHHVELDAENFAALADFALGSDERLRVLAFIGLERSNPVQFGEFLLDNGWRVKPSQTAFEQEHGSYAVLAAAQESPLGGLKGIVAPWCLLTEARKRGGRPVDAKLAAAALSEAVDVEEFDLEPPEVDISVDVSRRRGQISFAPAVKVYQDDEASFKEAFDSEAQRKRQEEAVESGQRFLNRAQTVGAMMAMKTVPVEDARMLVEHCSAEVGLWLDGYEHMATAFRKRLNLAGGLITAICEVLLETDWRQGVELWRALNDALQMKFVGLGGVSDLVHMLFRVQENPGVLELRREILSLARNLTDSSYMDVVLCAVSNGCVSWLQERIAEDVASDEAVRQKRAILMSGLLEEGSVASPTWPTGITVGTWDWLRRRAQAWTNRQAFARHWWRSYLDANDVESAFAAWHMFLLCADRRVLTWLKGDLTAHWRDDELGRLKALHLEVNWSQLEQAMREKESKGVHEMDRNLLGWDSPEDWFESQQLEALDKVDCRE